jgi:hypothetical protein
MVSFLEPIRKHIRLFCESQLGAIGAIRFFFAKKAVSSPMFSYGYRFSLSRSVAKRCVCRLSVSLFRFYPINPVVLAVGHGSNVP